MTNNLACVILIFLIDFSFFEKECVSGERGKGGGRETLSVSQDPDIMTWAEIKSWTLNRLSHPGAPSVCYVKDDYGFFRGLL